MRERVFMVGSNAWRERYGYGWEWILYPAILVNHTRMRLRMGADLVSEIIKQVPAVGALIFVVITFLRHIREDADRRDKQEDRRADADRIIEAEARTLSVKIATAFDRNTEAFFHVISVLERVEDLMDGASVSGTTTPHPRRNRRPQNPPAPGGTT